MQIQLRWRAVGGDRGQRSEQEQMQPGEAMSRPYRTICISIYEDDLTELDRKVDELKRYGFYRANRSKVIRLAVRDTSFLELADLMESNDA